ncbi:MAG: hypothetical protein MO846_10065 [Candidatus Devosia symbiotica]|nr:hypothetical protein [Candidatus Devosia symbiotica]
MGELGLRPTVISGISIGALIGASWAAGMSSRELREHFYEVLGTMRTIATKLWTIQLRGLDVILKNDISIQLDANSIVDSFIPDSFPLKFKDLKIPLYLVTTDFQSWHQVMFNSCLLRPAIAGSIAIPSLFKPATYANHILVDGGVINPLPLDQADIGRDFLIGIDVNGDPSESISKTDHIANFGALEFWRVREIVIHAEAKKDRCKRILAQKIEDYVQNRLLAAIVK